MQSGQSYIGQKYVGPCGAELEKILKYKLIEKKNLLWGDSNTQSRGFKSIALSIPPSRQGYFDKQENLLRMLFLYGIFLADYEQISW